MILRHPGLAFLKRLADVHGLSPLDRAVAAAVAWHADRDGRAWPAVATIAARAGCSARHARRALRRLRALGVLVVVEPERQHRPAVHQLGLDALARMPRISADPGVRAQARSARTRESGLAGARADTPVPQGGQKLDSRADAGVRRTASTNGRGNGVIEPTTLSRKSVEDDPEDAVEIVVGLYRQAYFLGRGRAPIVRPADRAAVRRLLREVPLPDVLALLRPAVFRIGTRWMRSEGAWSLAAWASQFGDLTAMDREGAFSSNDDVGLPLRWACPCGEMHEAPVRRVVDSWRHGGVQWPCLARERL